MESDTIRSLEARAMRFLLASAATATAAIAIVSALYYLRVNASILDYIPLVTAIIFGAAFIYFVLRHIILRRSLHNFCSALAEAEGLLNANYSTIIRDGIKKLNVACESSLTIKSEIHRFLPLLQSRLHTVEVREEAERDEQSIVRRCSELKRQFAEIRRRVPLCVDHLYQASPPVRAAGRLEEGIARLQEVRRRIQEKWDEADSRMTWWKKLNHEQPDFKKIDDRLDALKRAQSRLVRSGALTQLKAHFAELAKSAEKRLISSEQIALKTIPATHRATYDEKAIAKHALWLSALSLPVSAWSDLTRAGDIYDALRRVNGNYTNLSDVEIWLQSLMLPSDSLAGLVSLTKGAYFEALVAEDTGGKLFAAFNHPDTDIVIDGVAYQLKATDSQAYLDTVADGIPIIATSEVAQASDAIDSGIANADLDQATELALGGSVVDFDDSASDAVLVDLGGLGLLATLRGVGHAAREYNAGKDAESAIIEGIGVAVTGTVKSFVDTAELGYKALNSRPSRFVWRQLGKVASKIGLDGQ